MIEPGAALVVGFDATCAMVATGHALLNKRDPRSAWAWITACWLFPLGGSLLYWWFGVNRIQRRARRELGPPAERHAPAADALPPVPGIPIEVGELVRIGRRMSGRGLLGGNRISELHGGDAAYADMLDAVVRARRSVCLETYIFDGAIAERFTEALAAARARGVQVRVLLDGVGALSFGNGGAALLRRRGLAVRSFLPLRLWPPMLHINLRDHRKIMTVDGERAWAGGMNISDRHCVASGSNVVADVHFRFEGPVVAQLEEVFAENWRFASGETLEAAPAPAPAVGGEAWCRAVTDGPNDALDRLALMLIAALSNAHRRVSIMTPYFIPTPEISAALEAAALRGVEIELVLPVRSDQWWVDAATRRWLAHLAGRSTRVFFRPPPFAHTKLFLMDGYYALLGSANLDSRSLRLNFELMIETYDAALVGRLERHFDEVRATSAEVTLDALNEQALPLRLRDAACWLFSPYL